MGERAESRFPPWSQDGAAGKAEGRHADGGGGTLGDRNVGPSVAGLKHGPHMVAGLRHCPLRGMPPRCQGSDLFSIKAQPQTSPPTHGQAWSHGKGTIAMGKGTATLLSPSLSKGADSAMGEPKGCSEHPLLPSI